jgi:hypothetical protein
LHIHRTATWPARDDRRAAVVWLGIFWIFIGFGFGFDLKHYVHESPPVPLIVHIHAVMMTLWVLLVTALVALVETSNVRLHRRLGWFAAYLAPVLLIVTLWAQVAWQVKNLHTADAFPPSFLAIAFTGPLSLAILLPWGVLLRSNLAAHRRVLILSTIALTDPGFSRLLGLFVGPSPTWLSQYLFFFGGTLFITAADVRLGCLQGPRDAAVPRRRRAHHGNRYGSGRHQHERRLAEPRALLDQLAGAPRIRTALTLPRGGRAYSPGM